MSAKSSIEWTEKTWNPVRGCSIVSPGCVNCYAMKQAHRFSGPGKPYEGLTKLTARSGPQWTGKVVTVDSVLLEPLSWRKPARVFVNSMSDLFHEAVPDAFIDKVFAVMALAPRHTFQILTKRAERMRAYFETRRSRALENEPDTETTLWHIWEATGEFSGYACQTAPWYWAGERHMKTAANNRTNRIGGPWPLPNVWLGVSVEDQRHSDERIPLLLQTPAAVRFISAEPLLGPVDLLHIPRAGKFHDYLTGEYQCSDIEKRATAKLNWVIVGGESGPGARRCSAQWVRRVVRQCRAASVPVFVKQMGANVIDRNDAGFDGCDDRSWPVEIEERDGIEHDINGYREEFQGADCHIHLKDRKGGNPNEWPADLRVREFPAAAVPA